MRPPVATRRRSHWPYNRRRLRELHRLRLQISKAVARSQERGPVLPVLPWRLWNRFRCFPRSRYERAATLHAASPLDSSGDFG
jgi:hypothetical protein